MTNEDDNDALQHSRPSVMSSDFSTNGEIIPVAIDSSTSPVKIVPENISPIKVTDKGVDGHSLDDSGVQMDSSQLSSTQKNVYDFDIARENVESGICG